MESKRTQNAAVTQRVKQHPWRTYIDDVSDWDPSSDDISILHLSHLPVSFCPLLPKCLLIIAIVSDSTNFSGNMLNINHSLCKINS